MTWDDAVASVESTRCCFCGADFEDLWALRYQLHSATTGAPLNLWCCDECVPVATRSGYRARLDSNARPTSAPPLTRDRVAAVGLILALTTPAAIITTIAFAIGAGLLLVTYAVYAAATKGWF
jgi:hypothetical protein